MNTLTHCLAASRPLSLALSLFAGVAMIVGMSMLPTEAAAQGADVQITELSCDSDPEVVVITNQGQTSIDMTGWNLQSDPPASESLALQQFGSLSAGETLMVESGPAAEGAFVWSQAAIFRDDDPSDFAQLASDAGQVLLKVNCGAASQQTTATPGATSAATIAASTPQPTVLTAASAPSGGGPASIAAPVAPALLIALGTGLLTVGLGAFALPFSDRRRKQESVPLPEQVNLPASAGSREATVIKPSHPTKRRMVNKNSSPYVFLIVICLLLVGALLMALQSGGTKPK